MVIGCFLKLIYASILTYTSKFITFYDMLMYFSLKKAII
jgi:hypothetical protein